MQQAKLIYQPRPAYPPEAKAARIQGVVTLQAVIATDGSVKDLTVISGHPLLAQAALDAADGMEQIATSSASYFLLRSASTNRS